ncbi:hypothetical protein [Bradyrhizobium sp. I1.7.5]|uniref:hypothetical protein n=1 Tax=Bradyrhizobium sp. I1.7.5 TaxID=3156363 RepID=UPI00339576E5
MKTLANPLRASRCLQLYDDAALQKGVKISIGYDFEEYVSITRGTPTKEPTFPTFRPDLSPIKSGEGYWIKGVDKNNDTAFLAAARLYNLSGSNFAEHVESLKAFYGDPSIHADPHDRCVCIAPSAKRITGKVAYHGDLWVRGDFRGKGLTKIILGTQRTLSFQMWTPDFLCAFVARWLLEKGVCRMPHYEPGGSILRLVQHDILDDEWLAWRTGDELRSLVDEDERRDAV